MTKKIISAMMGIGMLAVAMATSGQANAQLYPTTSTSSTVNSSSMTSSTASATTSSSSTSSTSNSTMSSTASTLLEAQPIFVTATSTASSSVLPTSAGYFQMNGLTITNVSTSSALTQILAQNSMATCKQFATDISPTGSPIACPTLPTALLTITTNQATQTLLNNRSATTLASIAPGDPINVYGYYDGNGTINAEIIRDTSRTTSGMTPTINMGTTTNTTADLQAEINQLEVLVNQLEAELAISTSTGTSTIYH